MKYIFLELSESDDTLREKFDIQRFQSFFAP